LELKWVNPYSYSVHKNVPCYEVVAESGKTLIVSNDHSLLCLDPETLELKRVTPKESVGMYLPVLRNIPAEEKITKIEMDGKEVDLDYDLGFLFGMYCAEGCCTGWKKGNTQIRISTISDEMKEYLLKICREKLNKTGGAVIRKFPTGRSDFVRIYSTKLAGEFPVLFGEGANNKHLPTFFLSTPYEFRLGLLSGLLAGDGTISKKGKEVYISTTSERLAYEISMLAMSLGVRSVISNSKYTYKGQQRNYYRAYLNSVDIMTKKDQIYLHNHKQKRLKELPTKFTKRDIIPLPKKLRSIVYPRYSSNRMSRDFAMGIIEKINSDDPLYQRWKELIENDMISWKRVISFLKMELLFGILWQYLLLLLMMQ